MPQGSSPLRDADLLDRKGFAERITTRDVAFSDLRNSTTMYLREDFPEPHCPKNSSRPESS